MNEILINKHTNLVDTLIITFERDVQKKKQEIIFVKEYHIFMFISFLSETSMIDDNILYHTNIFSYVK